ncbi:16S rRNA (guanine(966)-N(2))-methyltransferase RsmD [Tindallia californiensis]|uniref:16S rRNA (Guanine(966)-N(2))-methyltransferase RsmD n=1 Tax=Tindallia californiensis TaxID=159292 RepID=A0A1H3NUI4_9FIRM|nr:16S rRNA (guanine(966)-N(2))-methyltransferase RsmD [Tindallia californiensis]SDY92383.1 16S rRNA (guanine(966)-N(2))-methyltransferase RsmD [Tindallia californiensis]
MRVISGVAKGHKIKAPKGDQVRPTTDRVKESVFNTIQHKVISSTVIDLFAGSGGLGIECISRGAAHVYFVEWSLEHVRCIKENLIKTRLDTSASILHQEVSLAIRQLHQSKIQADIIFLDPPYQQQLVNPTLGFISKCELLNKDGIIVIEHSKKEVLSKKIETFIQAKQKKYGDSMISYYRKEGP